MSGWLLKLQRRFFIRRSLFRLYRRLFSFALRGMGIANCQDQCVSGEAHFLKSVGVFLAPVAQPVIVDVGANLGDYAMLAKGAIPRSRIIALEPHPQTFRKLEPRAVAAGFMARNVACGAAAGRLTLYDYAAAGGSGHASLYRDVLVRIHDAQAVGKWEVDVVTIDDLVAQLGLDKIDLLKIDTEGHEIKVLHGARAVIGRGQVDLIQFEFNEMNIISRVFFHDFLDELPGYCFYRLVPDGLVSLDHYHPLTHELFAFQNIVAVRRPLAGAVEKIAHG